MANETQPESKIARLGQLADKPELLQDIGRRLVTQAIQNAVEQRMGQKNATPMVVRSVVRGQTVPHDLLGEPGLEVNPDLQAISGWQKSWGNLAIWDRSWSESESESVLPVLGLKDLKARIRLMTILTPDEVAVVEKLKIVE
jgi:hypothetical protein